MRTKHARRAKVFGSLLTFRLVLMFALVALVPGALVYTVSLQFLAKSIESWFDVRVENALEGGINLGRAALDNLLVDLRGKATSMALELSDQPLPQQSFMLNRMREQSGVSDALLVSGSGKVIATSSRDLGKLLPELPTFLATLTQLTALDLSTNVRGAWWGLLRGCGRVSPRRLFGNAANLCDDATIVLRNSEAYS